MTNLSTPLSANFILKEFLASSTAERDPELKRVQENPPEEVLGNLKYLVETAVQPIRSKLDYPIRITSGYRSPVLNKLIGGSATSQHCVGEAADCQVSRNLLTDPRTAEIRSSIAEGVERITGRSLRPDVDPEFYLFAFICLNLEELDIDQVIHEYGDDFGRPAWVHLSSSTRQDKRQILFIGQYTNRQYVRASVEEALARGTG